MKRLVMMVVFACLVLSSAVALATDPVPDPGKVTPGAYVLNDTGTYYSDNIKPRTVSGPYNSTGLQEAKVKLPIKALIPCYIEFAFAGNDLNLTLESFGYNSKPNKTSTLSEGFIAFYPSVGGFINDDWTTVSGSTGLNSQISPEAGKYIRACDTFMSSVWSNLDWKYSVNLQSGNGLTLAGETDVLPVQMRYALGVTAPAFDAAAGWTTYGNVTETGAPVIANGAATVGQTIWQQFRVPYTTAFKSGEYSNDIIFTIGTV